MNRSIKERIQGLAVVCLLGLTAACDKPKPMVIDGYTLKPIQPTGGLLLGAAREEITPYPGIPLGGHGPGGRIARGTWLPIYARAFYFQDSTGHAAALVTCDLFSVSAGLRAEVLRLVNMNKETRLEPGALFLSATHTHHGPANFASAAAYNALGGPLPNFDRAVFDFLAVRIARAVVRAIQDAHAPGVGPELLIYRGAAVGIQRNRAIAPFYMNSVDQVQQVQNESYTAGSRCPDGVGRNCPRYLSTDPSLAVLEIRRGGARRALLVFYAVHPTAMTHDSELYSPDLVGVAVGSLERDLGVVAGYFNGAEGDVSPSGDRQDSEDVLTLGGKLAQSVVTTLATAPVRRSSAIDIGARWNIAKQKSKEWKAAGFIDKPTSGAGQPGGAEDGRTVFYNYGFRGEARNAHAGDPKLPALNQPLRDFVDALEVGFLKPIALLASNQPGGDAFPAAFPVARLTLGTVADLAFIPVEATTLAGRAIRDKLGRDTIIIGLSNEYYDYAVTRAEYGLQQYEAGSTELGPGETEGIICLLEHVSPWQTGESIPSETFMPGAARKETFGPDLKLLRVPRNMVDDDLGPLFPVRLRRLESRVPRFLWTESTLGDHKPGDRRVALYSEQGNLIEEDRASVNFLTVFQGTLNGKRHYVALWIPPYGTAEATSFYFKVQTGDDQIVCSDSFNLKALAVAAPVPAISGARRCPQ